MKKNNSKRTYKKRKTKTKKRHHGGKKRTEKVRVVFARQHTNPDIFSMIRVEKGPQASEVDSHGEYLVNFISEVAKDFEEELAVTLKGPPDAKEKEKVYEFVFKDSDVALEPGADTPIKCRKPPKKSNEKKGGGIFSFLSGVQNIRGKNYEHWLEERLILAHKDMDFVNEVRQKFGYDKTNLIGRGQFTEEMIRKDVCGRKPEDKALIDPNLKCPMKD